MSSHLGNKKYHCRSLLIKTKTSDRMTPEEMGDEAMSSKKAAELISNWYQAYYSWQLGYMTSMASLPYAPPHYAIYPTVSSGSRHPLLLSSASHAFSAGSAQQQAAGQARAERRAAAAPPSQTTTQPPPHPPQTVTYRVPSLIRRFMAECFDTVYIQVVKVFVALMLINAEWMLVSQLLSSFLLLSKSNFKCFLQCWV